MLRTLVVILVSLGGVAAAGPTRFDYGIQLGTGLDTNPLRVAGDGPNGWFTELRLDASVHRRLGPRRALFFEADLRRLAFERALEDADLGAGDLRAGIAIAPRGLAAHSVSFAGGASFHTRRYTFVDPATGQVYLAPADPDPSPPSYVAVPDRYDADSLALFLNAAVKPARRVRLVVRTELREDRYVEDYANVTSLDPLDRRVLSVEPELHLLLAPGLVLEIFLDWNETDYDARPALDEAGLEVPGTRREYRYTDWGATARWTPSSDWDLRLGLATGGRRDTQAGYYDYGTWSAFASAERRVGRAGLLELFASVRQLDYDRATVTAPDALEASLGRDATRVVGRYQHALLPRLRIYYEAGVQHTDSIDPLWRQDRTHSELGLRWRDCAPAAACRP